MKIFLHLFFRVAMLFMLSNSALFGLPTSLDSSTQDSTNSNDSSLDSTLESNLMQDFALGLPNKEEQLVLSQEYSSQNLKDEVESLLKESKHQVSLSDLLEAAKNNDSLQSQLLQVESNRQIARVAKVGFIPKLDVDYSLQHSYSDLRKLDANAMKFGQFGNYRTQNFNARF